MARLEVVLKRRRWTRRDGMKVMAAVEASGDSMAAFARSHGLQVERLRRWRRRLARPVRNREAVEFAPVVLPSAWQPSSPAALEVAVGLATVRVPADFDAQHLQRLVAALAAC